MIRHYWGQRKAADRLTSLSEPSIIQWGERQAPVAHAASTPKGERIDDDLYRFPGEVNKQ